MTTPTDALPPESPARAPPGPAGLAGAPPGLDPGRPPPWPALLARAGPLLFGPPAGSGRPRRLPRLEEQPLPGLPPPADSPASQSPASQLPTGPILGPPAALAAAGRLLYGDEWQSPLAAELGALRRQVARWAAGDRAPPPDLWPWLRQRLADQAAALAGLMAAMAPPPPIAPPPPRTLQNLRGEGARDRENRPRAPALTDPHPAHFKTFAGTARAMEKIGPAILLGRTPTPLTSRGF